MFFVLPCMVAVFYALISTKYFIIKKQRLIIWTIIAFLLSIYAIIRPVSGDLQSYMLYLREIRDSGYSLLEFLTLGIYRFRHLQSYYIFNIICYVIAKIGLYKLLPAFFVFVDYLIIGYIIEDYFEINENSILSARYLSIYIICLGYMPLIHAMSGMRNAAAICISALSVYLLYFKGMKLYKGIVLFSIALFIHLAVVWFIPIVIISYLIKDFNWKSFLILAGIIIVINRVIIIALDSTNYVIQGFAYRYTFYRGNTLDYGSRRFVYGALLFSLVYELIILMNVKYRKMTPFDRFVAIYLLYVLSNIGTYDLMIRPMYLVGALSAPIIDSMLSSECCLTETSALYTRSLVLYAVTLISLYMSSGYFGEMIFL